QRYRGHGDVQLHIVIPNRSETTILLPDQLKMSASDEAMAATEELFGYDVMNFE
ncbi:MAG: hypothetical protein GQ563_03865, partial [Desulfuromusa sp.]|nr:hypothetical protein [Desulfuromusa sp.]